MGRLRGLPHKFGQILSLGEFESDNPVFSSLTDAADPVPGRTAFRWIEAELGTPIRNVFRRLDDRGAAASLGQVQRGELHDGTPVAVKIQYPEVAGSLDTDLAFLRWLSAPLSAHRSGFDLPEYRAELRRGLSMELDYRQEVESLKRFAARTGEVPGLMTPVPFERWCTSRLITMTWVEGERIESARGWPAAARTQTALTLLRFFLRSCFVWGELHADPHSGNLRFRRVDGTVEVGVIDFGCIKSLSAPERSGLRRLVEEGASLSAGELLEAYVNVGFNPALLEPMAHRLPGVTRILFEPFATNGPCDLAAWHLSPRLAEALGDDRWNFRFAGPASLLFVIRAFQGLVTYVSALEARLDWRAVLRELPALPEDSMHTPVASALRVPALSGASSMTASTLRLRVVRNGVTTVQLSFAATAAANLPDLVPQELAGPLRDRGIDLRRLAADAEASGFQPADLFVLDESDRTVRVWLE
jgi:predicted unusual protein kinase regulating ubiquinone biosynthesis (AarF/ABC1/UbiB family)